MTREAVRRYALVRFTKVILEVEAAAGARDPRLRVDDDLRPDDPRSHCRRQREQCALREAARIGDELRLPHCLAVELRQPIDRLRKQFRCRVFAAVPLGVFFWFAEAEVGVAVDVGNYRANYGCARRHDRRMTTPTT